LDGLSPKVNINFVPAKSLKLIFSFVKVLKLFLKPIPQLYADSGGQVIVRKVLGDFNKVYDLIFKGK